MTTSSIDQTIRSSTIADCKLLEFPVVADPRGDLTYLEGTSHVGFELKRVFYLSNVPGGATRAGHALKTTTQVLIAVSGSFDVVVDDAHESMTFTLDKSSHGLYLPPRIWRRIENFSEGAICLVLASRVYDEADYYRAFPVFAAAVGPRAAQAAS